MIRRLLASSAAFALLFGGAPSLGQAPQGPTVAAGSITVTRQGATTVVTQGTERGVLDWRSFSIGANETVRFDQPGRSSITLNRVTGADNSRIDGNMSATGQVWLANPNGVLIGPSGRINLGGLLVTTGRVDAPELLRSGKALIDQIPGQSGIQNSGFISIAEGGYAALSAASIRNDGLIAARSGSVAFGAGRAMTMDFVGDKLIQFQITQPLDQAPAGADALITSAGEILAPGGVVTLSARAAKGVIDNAINLSGHVVANAVRVDGGTVTFGDGGAALIRGKIDVSQASGSGGEVTILGEKIGVLAGAVIEASGAAGGGTVSIGRNAQNVVIASTAAILADATERGTGGEITIWSEDTTRFDGAISARGGPKGGDGGQVETSGKRALVVGAGAAVTTANRHAAAKPGSWLLDPTDITIQSSGGGAVTGAAPNFLFSPATSSSISDATIVAALANGNVTIQTAGGADGNGDVTFSGGAHVDFNGGVVRTFTVLADRDILFENGSRIDLTGAAHNILLNARASGGASGAITINNAGKIATSGGSLSLVGGVGGAGSAIGRAGNQTGVEILGSLTLSGGAVTIRGQGAAGVAGADGVFLDNAKIDGGAGGAITITGVAGGAGGIGVKINDSDLIAPNGALTLVSDSLFVTSSQLSLAGAALTVAPANPSTSIGVRGGAGALQLPASFFAAINGQPSGITIGRNDLSAPITIGSGLTLAADMTFVTGAGGDVTVAGSIDSAAGPARSLSIAVGAGASIQFAGAIGAVRPLQNLTLVAAGAPLSLPRIALLGAAEITSQGTVTQTGPLVAASLSLAGLSGNYALTDSGNALGFLAANTGSITVTDGKLTGLNIGVTTSGAAVLIASGALNGSVVTGASPLTLNAQGGAVNVTVAGQSGAAAAALVVIQSGYVSINGIAVGVTSPPPPVVTPEPPPTVETIPAAVIAAVTPSVTPILPPLAPTAPVIVTIERPSTAAPTPTMMVIVAPIEPITALGEVQIIRPIDRLAVDAARSDVAQTQAAGAGSRAGEAISMHDVVDRDSGSPSSRVGAVEVSAGDLRLSFASTASGALIPQSPAQVGEFGASLASSRTVKIDPADAGGEGGQGVFNGEGQTSRRGIGLPSQLWEELKDRLKRKKAEGLFSYGPPEINEEVLMD